jgi:hypothetical protein
VALEPAGETFVSTVVCLFGKALYYPEGGGVLWEYLNWALGLRSLGCQIIWLENVEPNSPPEDVERLVSALKQRLERYDLAQSLALCSGNGKALTPGIPDGCLDLDAAAEADLLLNMAYDVPAPVVNRFRRSALVDVDPGLTQIWIGEGQLAVPKHDLYFTTGETVGQPGALFPDLGVKWHYTPPSVALDWWPASQAPCPDAPFCTVSQWWGGDWVQTKTESYRNHKRDGFLPFLDLPRHTSQPLELALGLGEGDEEDCHRMRALGWRLRSADTVSSTPWDYQRYLQRSRGEFSCAKPSCIKLQNAWMSDRTIYYLACGKPAVVQHTGPSKFLPDAAGLFRFRTLEEAACMLDAVATDYERQCKLARSLAEEYFDARKNFAKLLSEALV